jgi:phage N-6-adenine-methyltransferase
MITSGMMTSKTDLWSTPQDFFDKLDAEFHFTLDVCATKDNAKCKDFIAPEDDGLRQPWRGICWMNPPYGNAISKWMKKAYDSAHMEKDYCDYWACTVVCLVPARTDTAWWHDFAMKGEIRFIRGRLKFGNSKNSAPFPSAVVIFRPKG